MTQAEAMAILEGGQSVLLTGAAGTGKTYVLNQFIKRAREDGKNVAVTATTGLAATHLSGTTLHSWAGIGIHDELPPKFLQKVSKQRRDLIKKADVLIIDEISMLHDFRLDLVDEVTRSVRESSEPFGGLQVILCGDFYQLPPVNRGDSRQGSFVTTSTVWQDGSFAVCYLEEQYRQIDDALYTEILNGIRKGVLSRNQMNALMARKEAVADPFTTRTRLLTTNVDVDVINEQHLDALKGDTEEYYMTTTGSKQYVEQLRRSCLAPETLRLKKGAYVMCIKNSQDKKYVNGSLGVVESFDKLSNYPLVKLTTGKMVLIEPDSWELVDGDKRRASLTQLPLRLAWAITVHKSQGMTLDAAQIDLSRAFVEGMGYVALSRVRGLRHLILDGINNMALRVSPLAKSIDAELRQRSEQALQQHAEHIKKWHEAEKTRKPKKSKAKVASGPWSEKLAKMREEHPNAYMPWLETDDEKLKKGFDDGKKVKELSKILGRHEGSIKKRLEKHYGEDVQMS